MKRFRLSEWLEGLSDHSDDTLLNDVSVLFAQDFLKENPDKQRDPEDLAQADKENIFDKDPVSQYSIPLHNHPAVCLYDRTFDHFRPCLG